MNPANLNRFEKQSAIQISEKLTHRRQQPNQTVNLKTQAPRKQTTTHRENNDDEPTTKTRPKRVHPKSVAAAAATTTREPPDTTKNH
ncbi:hypothetical protein A2U01_0067192 [Trifolium medium]|uniref:Uncharacterized protein n=1 Tax=Trifolium medium TaxID=97028 RepID=A0A392SBY2_9FABA|nr:hypothetical protein [Trifolium medium]